MKPKKLAGIQRALGSFQKHWRVDVVGLAAMGALSLTAYFGQIRPAIDERAEAATAVTQIAGERQHVAQLNNTLASVRSQTQLLRKPPTGTAPSFDSEAKLNDRLARLTDLVTASGVQVDSIQPSGGATPGPCFTVIGIQLSGRGGYRNCARLLRTLRQQMPDVTVSALGLCASRPGDQSESSVTLQLNWYAAGAEGEKTQ